MSVSTKPLLRGVSHQIAIVPAAVAGWFLWRRATNPDLALGLAIYACTLVLMYCCSALYHRPSWGATARQWLRRADHAAIYLLIAGTATAVALSTLGREQGKGLLLAIWISTAIGFAKALFWIHAPKPLTAAAYVVLTTVVAPFLPKLLWAIAPFDGALLLGGAAIYCAGALVYAMRRPNPAPAVFGYHEIFHALVIVASAIHFAVIWRNAV